MRNFIKYIQKLISSIFTSESSATQTNSSIGGEENLPPNDGNGEGLIGTRPDDR